MKNKILIKIYTNREKFYNNNITILNYLILKNKPPDVELYLPLKYIKKYIINKKSNPTDKGTQIIFIKTFICRNKNLTMNFILNNLNYEWMWPQLCMNDNLTVEEIYDNKKYCKYENKINWFWIFAFNKNLTINFINKYKNINWNYEIILNNINKNFYYNLNFQDIKMIFIN